jgi:hypothetical protein
MQQQTVNELVMLIGAVTTGIIRSSDTFSSIKLVRQEQAMGNALRDAMKRYKGDAGVEPVINALMQRQDRKEAKQPIEQPDLTDDEIMAQLAALDEGLADNEKSFKPFLIEIAEQVVKASASAGFLGIGKHTNEKETAFLNKMKASMKM